MNPRPRRNMLPRCTPRNWMYFHMLRYAPPWTCRPHSWFVSHFCLFRHISRPQRPSRSCFPRRLRRRYDTHPDTGYVWMYCHMLRYAPRDNNPCQRMYTLPWPWGHIDPPRMMPHIRIRRPSPHPTGNLPDTGYGYWSNPGPRCAPHGNNPCQQMYTPRHPMQHMFPPHS